MKKLHLIDEARTTRFEKPWHTGHSAIITVCGRVSQYGGVRVTHEASAVTCERCRKLNESTPMSKELRRQRRERA